MAVVQKLIVNGKPVSIAIDDPEMPLLYALRGPSGCMAPVSAAALASAAPAPCTSTVKPSARAQLRFPR